MTVNFNKHKEAITEAWKAIVDEKNSINWVLLGYENQTNYLKLMEEGNQLKELVSEFNCSLIQYAFCRVKDEALGINKLVLIHWQGESAPLTRKGLCASHVNDVANYFKGCSQTITLRNEDEATPEYILQQIKRSSSTRINLKERSEIVENMEPVGTNYKPLKVSQEIGGIDRKKFWQQEEEAEKRRIEEEKIRAEEKRQQFEKERKQREQQAEAKKQNNSIDATRQDYKDDSRPGAQSDQIRRERHQETSALISKGTIRNKLAIFEQQAAQSQPTNIVNRLERRPSGAVVTERVKAFRSLETSVSQPKTAQQPTKKIVSNNNSSTEATPAFPNGDTHEVKKAADERKSTLPDVKESKSATIVEKELTPSLKQTSITESPKHVPETNGVHHDSTTESESEKNTSITKEVDISSDNNNSIDNSSSSIEVPNLSAKALYDYQAADQTEISFDPDDIISHIERVDPGWWQGIVATGRFKGQVGLFPSNYVELLPQK